MFEAMVILGLIIANGIISCAETAVLSANRTRISEHAERGNLRARQVRALQARPKRYAATIQLASTLVLTATAVLGGVVASHTLAPKLAQGLPVLAPFATAIAVVLAVAAVSFFTVVFGRIIPRALAARDPDRLALRFGPFGKHLTDTLHPLSVATAATGSVLLKAFHVGEAQVDAVRTEEDIKHLLREGREKGEIEAGEQELIHSVFAFTDTSVREVMVPRPKMCAVGIATPLSEVLNHIAENLHARYPVFDGEKVAGILNYKDLIRQMSNPDEEPGGGMGGIRKLLHTPYFVPETMKVLGLLKELQRRRIQMAIVVDEYGDVSGLVTIVDLLEEIVGDIPDEYDGDTTHIQRMRDGSLVVDADTPVGEVAETHRCQIPTSAEYETLGGFLLTQLQGIPRGGEVVHHDGLKYTIVDMDGTRISRVKIDRRKHPVATPEDDPNYQLE